MISPSATKPYLVSTYPSATVTVSITSAPTPFSRDTPTPPGVKAPAADDTPILVVAVITPETVSVVETTLSAPDTDPRPATSMEPSLIVSSRLSNPSVKTSSLAAVVRPVFTVSSTARPSVLIASTASADKEIAPSKPLIAATPDT